MVATGGGEGLDDLGRVGDPVPVATETALKTVVQPVGWIAEMLELLQHRVGEAGGVGIAAQHEHRQAVGVGESGRGVEIGRAGTGGRGAEHETPAQVIFGVGGGGKAHALLVLAAIKRQHVPVIVERFAEAGDVAMAENAEAAAAKALADRPSISMNCAARYRTMACAVVRRTSPTFS